MLQPPTEGQFKTLEPLWKNVHNVARAQGYSVSTLRSNMTHNQIEIGCDRYGTPNPHKIPSKTTGFQRDDQTVGKEGINEAKKIFEDIGEDLFQRTMAEITPILQHFQDVLTGKFPFYQSPKSQEDDQYYEDPLECKNIHGRPQESKNKNKNENTREPSRFEIIESQSKRRGRPPSKVTSTKK
ncbi:hypothetical protein O181_011652 [Austropuccinia psidii MF-1]|uniref:Uncharacterized protein n=1 Tax=Austropuccinia psidii MF-1 TaxID=1389203 RepID=A0A9Q3BUX6_9BASI|nr:hypothetical protein [Austropuccinia psidii MF-1]